MPAESDGRFVIRRYRPGDEAAILDLFNRSFQPARTLAHWQWKYRDDPYGREHISLAFDGGRLAGQYAGYAVAYRSEGRDLLAHQIGDTMTDPSVRHVGRGPTSVLGRTALHFYENFCEGRIAFNYGFNVANIQKFSTRFLRAGRVEDVAYRRRSLRADPLRRISRVEKYARGVELELVRDVAPEWDELFARAARHYGLLVARDSRYVSWRYLSRPDATYFLVAMRKWRHLAGWLVFRIRESRMTIVDLFVDPDHADVVEIALRHLAAVYPVDVIEAWCPPRPQWMAELMISLRLMQIPEPQDLGVMCVPFVERNAEARMRESFYYTMGDSDLV